MYKIMYTRRGQKRKSASIAALEEASNSDNNNKNKKKNDTNNNVENNSESESLQEREDCLSNNAEAGSSSAQRQPPKPPRKQRRLDEVAGPSVAPATHRDGKNPDHEDHQINRATMPCAPSRLDKPMLEFILDILQRRDTQDAFSQPVDPKEVVGYYAIVKEPMDFGTVRAKLREGMYANAKEFESDIFLVLNNAMTFNSVATLYFRQARAIHELAKRLFHALKTDPERIENEFLTERRGIGRKLGGRTRRTRLTTNRRRGLKAECGSGIDGDVDFVAKRETYRPWSSSRIDKEPIWSIIDDGQKILVPVERAVQYKESLLQFGADLGPAAQKVLQQKLKCLTEGPDNPSQIPSCSIQHPESPNFPPPAQNVPTRVGEASMGNYFKNIIGLFGNRHFSTEKPDLFAGDAENYARTTRGNVRCAGDKLNMHGTATKAKNALPDGRMNTFTSPYSVMKPFHAGAEETSTPVADSMGAHGQGCLSGRSHIDGAALKMKSVCTDDSMGMRCQALGRHMAFSSDGMDIRRGALKGKEKVASASAIDTAGVPQEKLATHTDVFGVYDALGGERTPAIREGDINGNLHRVTSTSTPCVLGRSLSCGLNEPQQETNRSGFGLSLFRNGGFSSFKSLGADAGRNHQNDPLEGAKREDISLQNQNSHNLLNFYQPGSGTENLNGPNPAIKDANSKYIDLNKIAGSSGPSKEVQPTLLCSGSPSSLVEFFSRNNRSSKVCVHPTRVIKPSRLGQTNDCLHGSGFNSQSGMEQADGSFHPSHGANSSQGIQLLEWSRPTQWGPRPIYDINQLGKDAFMPKEPQPLGLTMQTLSPSGQCTSMLQKPPVTRFSDLLPLPNDINQPLQDKFAQNDLHLVLASLMLPQICGVSALNQEACTQSELQSALASLKLPQVSGMSSLNQEACTQSELPLALASLKLPQNSGVNALDQEACTQNELQLALASLKLPLNNNASALNQEALAPSQLQPAFDFSQKQQNNKLSALNQEAVAQSDSGLQFSPTPFMSLLTSEVNPLVSDEYLQQQAQHALVSNANSQPDYPIALALNETQHQEPRLAGVSYAQVQSSNSYLPGQEAFEKQCAELAPIPEGLMFRSSDVHAGPPTQKIQEVEASKLLWNQSMMSPQLPDLCLHLGSPSKRR